MSEHTKGLLAADDGDGEHFGLFAEDSGEAVAYLIEPAASARYAMLPRDEAYETDRAKAPGLVRLDVTYARYAEHKANARRLVACWNACERISTEALEDGCEPMLANAKLRDDLIAIERDELIEALRETSSMLRAAMLIVDDDYTRTTGLERATTNSVLLAKHAPKVPAERCPTCDSPRPRLHPAMQHEGEVQICRDPWHEPKVTA